jgi:hypothetical protein
MLGSAQLGVGFGETARSQRRSCSDAILSLAAELLQQTR